ncbi:MAG: hypothetical protein M3314_04465, partial [Actinomycetota bacterium]|nr:hypothetical protein [Actinomycetota bacterium]
MSFALVVVATITLVVGLLQSGLTLIYVSIACSVLAGLVLAFAVLRGRPEEAPAAGAPTRAVPVTTATGPSTPPPPSAAPSGRPWETAGAPTGSTSSSWGAPSTPPPPSAPSPPPAPEPVPEREYAGVGARPWASDRTAQMDVVEEAEDTDEGEFPIENYDRLRASEILRLLPDLSPAELERVRAREVSGMNRFTVLSRIDAQLEAAAHQSQGWEVREQEWGGAPRGEEEPEEELEPAGVPITEPEPEPQAAPAPIPLGSRRASTRAPRTAKTSAPAPAAPA